MDFKKGNWNIEDFNLEKDGSDLLDDQISSKIVGNLKKHIGPSGFPKPGSSNGLIRPA